MTARSRAEHLAWCKERALGELEADPTGQGPANAVASMSSDLNKHPETAGHMGSELGLMLLMGGHLRTEQQVREHIEGFQ